MENTLMLFEKDTAADWFVVKEQKLMGPVSGYDIALWVIEGTMSCGCFIWQEGMSTWRRVYQVEKFSALLPPEPNKELKELAKRKTTPSKKPQGGPCGNPDDRIWFMFLHNAQYGPFSRMEVELMCVAGRITKSTYLWKKGMADWVLAPDLKELKLTIGGDSSEEAEATEKREAPRKPFEARILLTDGQEVGWALCRDISVGGMQMLMDHSPGDIGTSLKLNVSESVDIPSFTCQGQIVRVLEDGRGISFRFTSLPTEAKTAIEEYIS